MVSSWSEWSSCSDDCRRQRRRQCHVTPCDDADDVQSETCPSDICLSSESTPADDQQISTRSSSSLNYTNTDHINGRLRDKSGFPNFPFSSLFLHLVLTILNTIPQPHRPCFRLCLCLAPVSVVVQSLVHLVSSLRSSCPNSLSFLITNANSFLSSTSSVISTLCHSKHIRDLPRV